MIDWPRVAFNGAWVLGCAILLATWSAAGWRAHVGGVRTRQVWETPAFQWPFFVGLTLIALGLCALGRGWLERVVWAGLALWFAWRAWQQWKI